MVVHKLTSDCFLLKNSSAYAKYEVCQCNKWQICSTKTCHSIFIKTNLIQLHDYAKISLSCLPAHVCVVITLVATYLWTSRAQFIQEKGL